MNPELHVVFGAWQVGLSLAARLLAAGCEAALGDAVNSTFCTEAARGSPDRALARK